MDTIEETLTEFARFYNNKGHGTILKKDIDAFLNKKPSAIPTLEEVKEYFRENGYSVKAAETAYNFYDKIKGRVWKDTKGRPIKNWRMKMRTVWFRPEHKVGDRLRLEF